LEFLKKYIEFENIKKNIIKNIKDFFISFRSTFEKNNRIILNFKRIKELKAIIKTKLPKKVILFIKRR
tara:strand:+ start:253 stop:456 length:204 start_codon:yes stop_codon:yes gene_type:complete